MVFDLNSIGAIEKKGHRPYNSTMKYRSAYLFVCLFFLLFPGPGPVPGLPVVTGGDLGASTVIRLSLSDLVAESEAVVIGTVVGQEYEPWGNLVFTRNVVEIEECLCGGEAVGGSVVEIWTMGGRGEAGISVFVFGEARFEVGERFLAFLARRAGRWRVVGMAQGKVEVKVDEETGSEIVLPPGRVNVVAGQGGALVQDTPWMIAPVPLDELVDEILLERERNAP
jgi:hypothetical protein